MKKTPCMFCMLLFVNTIDSDLRGQSFILDLLFAEPRHGGFKILKQDDYDISDATRYVGSGVLAVGFYKVFRSWEINHSKVWAGVLTSGLGLLKEWQDGYREGWSFKDTILNELGIVTFLLLSDHTHFALTIDEVFSVPNNFGIGLRFFRTSEFMPLNSSIGFFTYYNNNNEVRMGLDAHLTVVERSELHIGLTFFRLRDANNLDVRPDFGVGFKLL